MQLHAHIQIQIELQINEHLISYKNNKCKAIILRLCNETHIDS